MNIYPGLTARNIYTEREYKVTAIARHFLRPELQVVFTRNIQGSIETNVVSEDYFQKNFKAIDPAPFFRREAE